MSLFQKLFGSKSTSTELPSDTSSETQIGNHIKSMIEICMEYIGAKTTEVDHIYLFANCEEGDYINFSFGIQNEVVKKHKVNEYISKAVDTSPVTQQSALKICMQDLLAIKAIFKNDGRDMFTQLEISYNVKTQNMSSDFRYEKMIAGTSISPEEAEKRWISALI